MDILLKNKFNRYINIKNYNTKICRNYLSLCNLKIPNKLKDKQDAIIKYQDSIKEKLKKLEYVKVQSMVATRSELVAQIITFDNKY